MTFKFTHLLSASRNHSALRILAVANLGTRFLFPAAHSVHARAANTREIPKHRRLWYYLNVAPINNPILRRFRAALDEVCGEPIERVVLFGSRARGDARVDSDYDVAVFLKDFNSVGKESGHIAEIEIDVLNETGAVISAMPFKARAYETRTGLMRELRREGVDL
jgi:predicted nucleotidyltransferase